MVGYYQLKLNGITPLKDRYRLFFVVNQAPILHDALVKHHRNFSNVLNKPQVAQCGVPKTPIGVNHYLKIKRLTNSDITYTSIMYASKQCIFNKTNISQFLLIELLRIIQNTPSKLWLIASS